ncbi:MAG: M23 family metallopeptidase [Parcubacteria group bacterium]|nr:M23 family metallopeptidase [Parcubacteria group bacterium]
MTEKSPLWVSLFLVFSLVLAINSSSPAGFKNRFVYLGGENIGGEIIEIVSAPDSAQQNEGSPAVGYQSTLLAFAASASSDSSGILEEGPYYDDRNPLITGQDSILQNQNPITIPSTPEPSKPAAPRPAPYYGPSLTGYFIFPTTGHNQGRLHSYNAVDISAGDDCLHENIPVFAAASGVVTAAYPTQSTARWANSGYGGYFKILHPNGVTTLYAHLKNVLVNAGQYVNQGSIVAFMGGYPGQPGSGNSTGCHLHFGVDGAAQPFAR